MHIVPAERTDEFRRECIPMPYEPKPTVNSRFREIIKRTGQLTLSGTPCHLQRDYNAPTLCLAFSHTDRILPETTSIIKH